MHRKGSLDGVGDAMPQIVALRWQIAMPLLLSFRAVGHPCVNRDYRHSPRYFFPPIFHITQLSNCCFSFPKLAMFLASLISIKNNENTKKCQLSPMSNRKVKRRRENCQFFENYWLLRAGVRLSDWYGGLDGVNKFPHFIYSLPVPIIILYCHGMFRGVG